MIRPLLLASALALAACGSPHVGEPFGAPIRLASSEAERGERVFMANCHECHPGGAAGLGPALNNKPLPGFLIRHQTRLGLGAMPEFDEAAISDADVDAVVAYLKELRRQRAS
jgi:mono/diheme cytochrome c family protein